MDTRICFIIPQKTCATCTTCGHKFPYETGLQLDKQTCISKVKHKRALKRAQSKISQLFFGVLLIMATVIFAVSVNAYECSALQDKYRVSAQQKIVMHESFLYADTAEIGYALAAIAFLESSAGLKPINRTDPSAGIHHVLLRHVMRDFDLANTAKNREFVIDMLVSNPGLSKHYAQRELLWWYQRHNYDMFKALRSYNQGYYWRLPVSQRTRSWHYAKEATSLATLLKKSCNWSDA